MWPYDLSARSQETEHGVEYPPEFRAGIACVAWRRDGMTALEPAPGDGGYTRPHEVTTVPLQFARGLSRLLLNVDTGAGGSCLVAIEDASTGKRIATAAAF